jgi:branched-chain amino acid transport system substrate-binding protein
VLLGLALAGLTVDAAAQTAATPPPSDPAGRVEALRRAAREARPAAALELAERQLALPETPPDVRRVAGLVGGRAAWQLGHDDRALRLLRPAVTRRPFDTDWGDGVEALVELLAARRFWFRAAQWSVALAAVWPERAAELLDGLPPGSLTTSELHYLGWQASTAAAGGCQLLAGLAGQAASGSELAAELTAAALAACDDEPGRVMELRAREPGARPAPLGFYDIAVICPINGRYARYGESLAQGALVALEEVNHEAPFPMRMQVLDSRGDALVAARVASRAVRAGSGALLGDMLTPATISVAAAAEAGGTPLVSPVSTQAALGAVGDQVFQTIVPREVQAEALARAAVERLGFEHLAVLHPATPSGAEIADRFVRTVMRLGAEVVAVTPYPEDQTNFALELEPLGEQLVDAVFIPGSPKELMAAVPQLAYYEVDARVLALEDLGLSEVLGATGDYLEEALFADSYYRVPAARIEHFTRDYAARYGHEPDPYATRGYVAMGVLARAMQGGPRSRHELQAVLAGRTLRDAPEGMRGTLRLEPDEGRVALFQVDHERVVPLD